MSIESHRNGLPEAAPADREDSAIERVFEHMEAGDAEELVLGTELEREHTELLALLPYALEPAAPSAELRGKILANLDGANSQRQSTDVLPFEAPQTPLNASPRRRAPHRRTGRDAGRRSWRLAQAAAIALCALGLGYTTLEMRAQGEELAQLTAELEAARSETSVLRGQLAQVEHFTTVAGVAENIYRMRPARANNTGRAPDARIYICGKHRHWYLDVRKLEPAPEEHEYHLWFLTDDGMVSAGTLTLRSDDPNLLMRHLPEGTRGFALSLETSGPRERPEGEMVLMGEKTLTL